MPLRNHFRAPLLPSFHWTSFHARWTSAISDALNERLPDNYHASPQARFHVEIDVATLETEERETVPPMGWLPSEPSLTLAVVRTTDIVEVRIFARDGLPRLVAAIELVSPANKDAPDSRAAFVAKCVGILETGAGLMVIDIVTGRTANLHAEVVTRYTGTDTPGEAGLLIASSYRPTRDAADHPVIQVWSERLALGGALPTLPLWLLGGPVVPVDLNATYEETVRRLRLPPV